MERHEFASLAREWERLGLSRRAFLRLLVAGASATVIAEILAACGGNGSTATTGPAAPTTSSASTAAATATTASSTSGATPAATTASGGAGAATRTGSPAAAGSPAGVGSPAAAGNLGFPSGGKYSTLDPVGKKGGRIIEGGVTEVKTFNHMISSDVPSNNMIALMFSTLVNVNPDTALPYPDAATEVPTQQNGGISSDGLTYTFKLRKDVKWHDGKPLTAKDVVYTYTTMQKKELGSQRTTELNERVDSITAPDDSTVVFKLKKVVAPFLVSNMYRIVPEHILKDVPVDKIREHPFSTGDPKATIGSGPFKFGEYVKGDHVTVVKNPDYFLGEPALDQYIYKVVKDSNVLAAQLKTGEVDYGPVTAALFEEMTKEQSLNVGKYDTYGFFFYTYQLDTARTPLFQDKAVRQALAYALDREAMVKAIQYGLAVVAVGTEPVLSWAYAPDKITNKYPYDPNKANQLLDQAGWVKGSDGIRAKGGQRLAFTLWTYSGDPVSQGYITAMQQLWRQVGVDCTPKTEEFSSLVARLTESYDFEMVLVGFSWGVDPDQTTMWATSSHRGGFNMGKYANSKVDELLDKALSELDQEKRKQLYIEMQNVIMEDVPNFILSFTQTAAAVNKRVHNLKPNAVNIRWNSHTWWVG